MTKRVEKKDSANLRNQAHIIYRFSAFELTQGKKDRKQQSSPKCTDNLVLLSFRRQRAVIAVICFYALVSRSGDSYCTHMHCDTATDCKLSLMIIIEDDVKRVPQQQQQIQWKCENASMNQKKNFHVFATKCFYSEQKIKIYWYSLVIEDDVWSEASIQNICAISRSRR